MKLSELEEIVDNIILQHSYPGFESRSLKLSLPLAISQLPASLYLTALNSHNVFVQLFSLRWFQTRPGIARNHAVAVAALLDDRDPWVRLEAIRTLEMSKALADEAILKITSLLTDPDELVRTEAAKACGCISTPSLEHKIVCALQEASHDPAQSVRRKAVKSLRKLGAFSVS